MSSLPPAWIVNSSGGLSDAAAAAGLPAAVAGRFFQEGEGFYILGIDVSETRKLADAAGREMAAETATDVLTIEDETFTAMHSRAW